MTNPAMIQDMLQAFRRSFLAELPERLDKLEQQLFALEGRKEDAREVFNDLYRGIHSIKGSGGTFGLHIITSICHEMEDFLNLSPLEAPRFDRAFVDNGLLYIDLMRSVCHQASTGDMTFPDIEGRLAALHDAIFARRFTALVVVNSKLTRSMCHEILQASSIHWVDESDGLAALHRLLTQPFDLLVVSSELPLLKGEAVISSLRLSQVGNKRTTSILISASPVVAARCKRDIDPDYVLARDAQLLPKLTQTVQRVIQKHSS